MQIRSTIAATLASAVLATSAFAAPAPDRVQANFATSSATEGTVELAQYRPRRAERRAIRRAERRAERRAARRFEERRRDRRRYRRNRNRALGIGAAVIGGAIIVDSIAKSRRANRYYREPVRGYSSRHVDWCYNRYRSYRASDNTFQPYHGGRRACYSPYN